MFVNKKINKIVKLSKFACTPFNLFTYRLVKRTCEFVFDQILFTFTQYLVIVVNRHNKHISTIYYLLNQRVIRYQ